MKKEDILKNKEQLFRELERYYNVKIKVNDNNTNIFCKNCKHHDKNFWGYDECWFFNKTVDGTHTIFTAERERTAVLLNHDNKCNYFEEKRKYKLILNKIFYIQKTNF